MPSVKGFIIARRLCERGDTEADQKSLSIWCGKGSRSTLLPAFDACVASGSTALPPSNGFRPIRPPREHLEYKPWVEKHAFVWRYLSGDFHQQRDAQRWPIVRAHDRDRLEVLAYSYGPDDNSPMARTALAPPRTALSTFAPCRTARQQDKIMPKVDILIDLKGYTIAHPDRRYRPIAQHRCR